jgi:hypothetical protein
MAETKVSSFAGPSSTPVVDAHTVMAQQILEDHTLVLETNMQLQPLIRVNGVTYKKVIKNGAFCNLSVLPSEARKRCRSLLMTQYQKGGDQPKRKRVKKEESEEEKERKALLDFAKKVMQQCEQAKLKMEDDTEELEVED